MGDAVGFRQQLSMTSFEAFELEIAVNYPVHTWMENGSFVQNLASWSVPYWLVLLIEHEVLHCYTPTQLRDPAVGPDQFRRDLKTHLFEWHCISFSALVVFSRNALYKSTFYLLTYFTYSLQLHGCWTIVTVLRILFSKLWMVSGL